MSSAQLCGLRAAQPSFQLLPEVERVTSWRPATQPSQAQPKSYGCHVTRILHNLQAPAPSLTCVIAPEALPRPSSSSQIPVLCPPGLLTFLAQCVAIPALRTSSFPSSLVAGSDEFTSLLPLSETPIPPETSTTPTVRTASDRQSYGSSLATATWSAFRRPQAWSATFPSRIRRLRCMP